MALPTAPRERIVVREARDVVDAINTGRVRGGNEKAIVVIALGGIFIDAYDFTSLAFGLPEIAEQFGLGAFAQGVVGASIMIGALLGALFGGYLVDRIGRYKMFMADMLFFVVSAPGWRTRGQRGDADRVPVPHGSGPPSWCSCRCTSCFPKVPTVTSGGGRSASARYRPWS